MMYNYPFFSFSRFRRYPTSATPSVHVPYSSYVPRPSYGNVSVNSSPFVPASVHSSPTTPKQRTKKEKIEKNPLVKQDSKKKMPFLKYLE